LRQWRPNFLDLKFHDIPNTVAQAVLSACELKVDLLTIHTQGGSEMMKAAAQAAMKARESGRHAPKIIGVTVLTSIDQKTLHDELHVSVSLTDHIKLLIENAACAGLDGIVCSAADLSAVRSSIPDGFTVVTPGIRPAGTGVQDQKRIATPQDAIRNGATLLVVGRPVTAAADPSDAARQLCLSIEQAL
jgi:orotidine-5'-phosphate decarboxylase